MNWYVDIMPGGAGLRLEIRGGLTVAFLLLLTGIVQGQDANPADREAAARLAVMKESVSRVELRFAADPDSKFGLLPEPVQRWNNLVSGIVDGTVFVWTRNGRPEAAAQVFRIPDGRWLQEFQSLSSRGLTGLHGGRTFWSPAQAGIEMKRLSTGAGASTPSPNEAGRRAQMRMIGRQFRAKDIFGEEKEPYDLRLLPKPLYEYGDPDRAIVHGGLYAFVHGTDPEVLLLIEAHKGSESLIWKIGFAPLTSYQCLVTRDGAKYWACPKRPPPNQPTDTFLLHVLESTGPQ